MLLFVTLGVGLLLSLFVAIMASLEVFHISGSSRGDPDLSHGLQIRRWFMATIALANGARVVCSLLNEIYAYSCEVMNVSMKDMVLVTLEVCPSLLYFTMYSLLTVYFAQLSYTVKGLPFFHVRNSWFITNLLLYAIVLLNFVLESSAEYVYLSVFTAYILNLIVVVWFSFSVFSYFPSNTSGNLHRITKRLLPLIVVCFTGLAFNGLNYFICFLRSASNDSVLSTPSVLEVLTLVMAETVPSIAFLFLVSKRTTSGEQASLLTSVVDSTTNPFASREEAETRGTLPHRYEAIGGTTGNPRESRERFNYGGSEE
jgi:hypothetical protein